MPADHSSQSKPSLPTLVIVDGSGARYTIVSSSTTYLLQGEDGKLIQASQHMLRGCRMEVER